MFSYPLNESSLVSQIDSTSVQWDAPGEGSYYVTVVAYNNALQPSLPVCSDGITVDLTPPVLMGVLIPGARVRPGLVVDNNRQFWLVERDRQRLAINGYSSWCSNGSALVDEAVLSTYPLRRSTDGYVFSN